MLKLLTGHAILDGRTDGRTREHGKYTTGNVTAMTSIHKQARM